MRISTSAHVRWPSCVPTVHPTWPPASCGCSKRIPRIDGPAQDADEPAGALEAADAHGGRCGPSRPSPRATLVGHRGPRRCGDRRCALVVDSLAGVAGVHATGTVGAPRHGPRDRAWRGRARERGGAAPRAAATESAARTAVAQREDSLVRSLRARALSAMSRAIEAGATPAELARGDTVFKGA